MAKLIKCSKCGLSFESIDIIEFNRKKYCIECFETSHKPEVVDQHYFYLKFQELFNRKPNEQEWTQCRRLINNTQSSGEWDWRKIEKVMTYVYNVERKDISEEHGVIGILPYYEYKADKFYDEYYEICDIVDELGNLTPKEEHIYIKPRKKKPKEVKLKSIDKLINWEEEE